MQNDKVTKGIFKQQAEFFNSYGYVALPELFEKEDLSKLLSAYEEAEKRGDVAVGEDKILNLNDAIYRHSVFEKYAKDPRIVALLSEIFQTEELELQHSKFFNKPAADSGKGEVKWHQDFSFFPHTNYDLLALAIHLDDEHENSGSIQVVPESHKWGVLSHVREGNFAYEVTEDINSRVSDSVTLMGKAGNVTLHHGLTLHASAPKRSSDNRRILYLQYRPADCVQLAGVVWKCTGYRVSGSETAVRYARFPDGSRVELRGGNGRLFDLYGRLAPDNAKTGSISS